MLEIDTFKNVFKIKKINRENEEDNQHLNHTI